MDTPDHEDRLTILERAQLLHDATLRCHSDVIERHEERIALLTSLMEQQARTLTTLTEVAARLDATLQQSVICLIVGGTDTDAGTAPKRNVAGVYARQAIAEAIRRAVR